MALPATGRILGVDWGTVRFGIAMTDETQTIASPVTTLTRRPGKRFPMPAFQALVERHAPVGVVIGWPLTPEGTEGESALAARDLAETITRRTGLPMELWDERFSTASALRSIRDQGGSPRGRKEDVDSLAASLLLQHWLEARRSGPGETDR
jgi:putative Holliday junction resolvase